MTDETPDPTPHELTHREIVLTLQLLVQECRIIEHHLRVLQRRIEEEMP